VLNNFRNLNSLYQSLGARWLFFRVGYALRKRTGFIRKQIPAYNWKDRPLETWLKTKIPSRPETYAEWRRQNSPKFFFEPFNPERNDDRILSDSRRTRNAVEGQLLLDAVPWNPQLAVDEAESILNGELKYFAHKFIKTGFPPDWHKDPVSGIKLDSKKHWSEISDDGEVDIKFIWEASRFSMIYPLVRAYASTRDDRYAEGFWALIESWAVSNPPNTGPNWMDGQEAALRLMTWMFGFSAFMDSPSTTPERIAQFTVMIAAHAERIYKNIDFAISTHSNHTITEAFGLWLVGLLFPELKDAETYLVLGRQLLEQEAAAQIFPDGSYSMYSLNYHRFITHIYLCMMRLGALNQSPVSNLINASITASIDFLSQFIDPETGQMPVYGSNDGALVLPLNNCDFTDYRPLLQLGWYLTKKELLLEPGPWDEDLFWLCGEEALIPGPSPEGRRAGDEGETSFPDGGIYLLRGSSSKAIIHCTDFRARPSHADQLHVDIWWRGINIACDAGTYLYTGKGIWRNGLAHTSVHNTVTVDHQDQMKMVSRFTWTNWARGKVLRHDKKAWQGKHNGYKRLADPVNHKRTVLALGGDRWLVVDQLNGERRHHYALHWLFCDGEFGVQKQASAHGLWLVPLSVDGKSSYSKIFLQMGLKEEDGNFSIVRGDPNSTRGWRSRYYGQKEAAISVRLEADQPRVCFWTFFGFESDSIKLTGEILKVSSSDIETSINIAEL
jgi:hypothetical protein